MIPKEITEDVVKRIATVKGQLEGIIKMINGDSDPDKILIQFEAATQGLRNAHHLLLDDVFRKNLAIKIVEVMNACPGNNCPYAEKIEHLKKQFPSFQFDELASKIKEIKRIDKQMEEYHKNLQKDLDNTP
jgi:DNA-binding FrmR family transcriptional regulator